MNEHMDDADLVDLSEQEYARWRAEVASHTADPLDTSVQITEYTYQRLLLYMREAQRSEPVGRIIDEIIAHFMDDNGISLEA